MGLRAAAVVLTLWLAAAPAATLAASPEPVAQPSVPAETPCTPSPAPSPSLEASPAVGTMVLDTFDRCQRSGWGTPDVGLAWAMQERSAEAAKVDGDAGRLTISTAQSGAFAEVSVDAADLDITARWMLDGMPEGSQTSLQLWPRVHGASDQYRFYLLVDPSGDLSAGFRVVTAGGPATSLGSPVEAGKGFRSGEWWNVRVSVVGSNPTDLRARIWRDGEPEPGTWTLEQTSAAPSLQGSVGDIRVGIFVADGETNLPISLVIDELQVTAAPVDP